jgi:plasmid maintenance system antidote protein VapI
MAQSGLYTSWARDAGVRRAWVSLPELASTIGLPARSVWEWIAGRRDPYTSNAVAVAKALGVSVDAVARACRLAQERERARVAARDARLEALRRK